MRLYWPHQDVIDGTWKFPEAQPVKSVRQPEIWAVMRAYSGSDVVTC
jgi:hypothetical protein